MPRTEKTAVGVRTRLKWAAPQLLDVHFDPSDQDIQQILPGFPGCREKRHASWEDFKLASIRKEHLLRKTFCSRHDNLPRLDHVANVEGPWRVVAQNRNLTHQRNYFSCAFRLGRGEQRAEAQQSTQDQWLPQSPYACGYTHIGNVCQNSV